LAYFKVDLDKRDKIIDYAGSFVKVVKIWEDEFRDGNGMIGEEDDGRLVDEIRLDQDIIINGEFD
jgi:hypothetical protein